MRMRNSIHDVINNQDAVSERSGAKEWELVRLTFNPVIRASAWPSSSIGRSSPSFSAAGLAGVGLRYLTDGMMGTWADCVQRTGNTKKTWAARECGHISNGKSSNCLYGKPSSVLDSQWQSDDDDGLLKGYVWRMERLFKFRVLAFENRMLKQSVSQSIGSFQSHHIILPGLTGPDVPHVTHVDAGYRGSNLPSLAALRDFQLRHIRLCLFTGFCTPSIQFLARYLQHHDSHETRGFGGERTSLLLSVRTNTVL
ncbi:uncharacterized protein B0T23DRAFT_368631 [Neurospora hispaniola]|uniref:Uncharacterized protein n=1 Tax=Neurospora hispaniola TaxID=588809 RepID=A0AAJ0MV12_9PEZI|nr:hypothetical protein B0T23DRAFT_368631 [Neurospora hispaniola]